MFLNWLNVEGYRFVTSLAEVDLGGASCTFLCQTSVAEKAFTLEILDGSKVL